MLPVVGIIPPKTSEARKALPQKSASAVARRERIGCHRYVHR